MLIAGWSASLGLFVVLLKCAKLTAFHWWAAGFRDDPNVAVYQWAGDWYFVATIASLLGSIAFGIGSIYLTLRRRHEREKTSDTG